MLIERRLFRTKRPRIDTRLYLVEVHTPWPWGSVQSTSIISVAGGDCLGHSDPVAFGRHAAAAARDTGLYGKLSTSMSHLSMTHHDIRLSPVVQSILIRIPIRYHLASR